MRKENLIRAIICSLFLWPVPASADYVSTVPRGGYSSYSCSAGGFNLSVNGNTYRFSGPIYAPLPGYTANLGPITFETSLPDATGVLTLMPPGNATPQFEPMMMVPPLWVDYSFFSPKPMQRLTIAINQPYNRPGAAAKLNGWPPTEVVCVPAGSNFAN